MAETKKMELSNNVTLSFLGNETINEVKLYKYEAKIKNVEKTKTIYLEKEASKYDKTILSDYIIRMVEEYDDQDAFFIVSNGNSDDNKEETDSLNSNKSDSKTEETSNAGGGSESYGEYGGKTYSDDTVELFQNVAKNAGEFDGSNLDAYKFDLIEFITFKPSVDKLKFISLGELPSAKSSLGQAAVKASEGGCDEAVGMIEDLKADIESKQIEDAMDAQVQFYQEVDEIQLQQMQRDAQLNFEDDAVTFDPTQYIVSEQEYKDGMRNTLYGTYDSLADFMNAIQNYNYQVLSSTGRMSFAKDSAGLEFFAMTDAEKDALANGEEGTIDFDAGMLAKLGLNSTSELLGIVGGFKSANDLDDFLNSIGDNDAKLAVNEYVNKLIDSRWFNEFSSTEEGKQAYYEYFVNSAKENPNRTAKYDEYDAVINTEYINNCIMSGQENLIISELASRPLILRIINDETGIFGNNISYYADIEDEELIASYEKYAKENDGNYPDGIKKVNGSLKQKTYTLIGEQFLYEMDYHADEWKANYNPEKKKYTAFSKQARYDAEVRSNKGEFVQNYKNSGLTGDAERDWAILNGQIEDEARLAELKENGCLSFEDNYKILQIISASGNEELLAKINEVGINGLDKKDKNTFDTILKNAGYNDNQLWNFKLKYGSDDNENITTYIEDHHQNLLDKIKELEIREHQFNDLTKEEKEKLNEMRKQADVLSKMDENSYNNLSEEEKETFNEMLKQAGFSSHEISNYKSGANSNSIGNATQTFFSTRLTTDIAFLKGVAKFVENCRDAGITISNNNFWLLLNGENDGAIKETKKYKEMQQELYDKVMSAYKENGAYDRDYEAFKNSNSFEKDVIDYLVTQGYERDTLRLKQAKIDELEELKKLNPKGSASYNMDIENVKSEIEKLYQEAFLDSKVKELNLGDANASSQMSAAIKLGIRTGDFSKLYEYEKDQQMVDMANNQYSTMLDVAVDNVGNWVQGNIYEKDWYQAAEDASLVKKDNFLGICVDQIGNMAIPIGLSMFIPEIGGALGATSASSTAALGALAKAASSTALWTSAFGGASEEAFSQGANYGDATKYALLSATTELATEWMFSGIMGFGTGWYDDALKSMFGNLDKTLGNLSSKIIKNPKTRAIIEKLIISGIGEGTEEVVTDLITPLWRSWTLEKENSYLDILHRDVSAESLFETFSIAFVTSLFFSGMSINGQKRNLNKNIENLSRITESNPAFNEALRNMSSDLFAQIIENDGRLSQREIFNEVIGRFREQIMADPQLREAMDQANAELLKDVIKTDANNNITNMQEVIERLFNDNLLENATAEDISTIENVLTRLTKSNTNITAEQIYQELLNSDSKLFADNFANASQLNETIKNFIKSFNENSFSYEFKDGSKIDLSQALLSDIAELDQTLHTNSFEINNGELVVKNESKFRKLIEHAAKDKISNLKYQNNLFRKKLGLLNDIDADTIENALYFMDQDSTIAHYTNDNVILEYDGKSINVPVNLAVQIANEIRLDNYIKDGKLVFKSEKEMKAFVNKTCELGAKAIDNINKRIDTTPNKTFDDALNINNNRINMEADKNALIINRVVLEDGIVAYDVIMKNEASESDVANENDTGIRRKIIYTTEENLKNVFNEKGLAQDVIDLMNQNEDAANIYLELTNEQVANIEKRIKNEQEKAKEKSNAIEETGTQENSNEKMIQERAETREQQTNENEVVDNKDTNVRENIVERNDSSTSEATRVKVRPRENASTNVSENTNVGENIVERNDSSTSEATRVKVRPRENASTNVNEAAKASERVDAAQRNNATQTNADVIRNTASAATVVINAVTNNANKASIVVDAPVYGNNTSNREAQGVQNNQNAQNIQNDTANDIKNGFDAMGNGVREAGRRRVMELVQKNGYVAYRNEDAARLFEQNPEYKDWRHEVVDGEHRFYPPESNQSSEVIHTIDEGTIRNTQTVLETNSEIEVIKPENVEQNINQKFKRGFDPSLSYEGFDYVVKPKTSFEQALNEVIANNNGSNIVIEINNTTELTLDLIEQIPDNVKVRVTGDYNVDFMNTFKSAQQSGNGTLRNVTYTKEQLKSIMTEIYEFEKGIDPNWSDMEKARYAYDYLKNNIEYHDVKQIHELSFREGMAGNNADRLARYDGLVNLIEKSSTCQGFAATYQELLTRMGIESRIVSGNLNGEGQHVYNVVKIDGKTFIVDSVREMLDANSPGKYPGSGFNVENIFEYHAKSSYQELIKESVLTQISENIDGIIEKGVYNNMNLEELSDFIKDNYSDAQIPSNLKEFIHQVDEFKLDKAANEVEVEDIHIDEYANRINEEQVSGVEVLNRAKEDLAKLRGGAAGIISKFLKANAVVLTTIADPSLGIGSTITYNMVAQQILNGEFVANNRATEIMKETTLKILTWGYGKEQKTQIRNQIKYIEQVRMDLIEQGIDLDVSRSKKIQNIISDKTKVVKENIKNVYGNVKARFNNNVKTNEIVVNETSMSNEIVNNRDSRINELIDMSRNGTDIHYEYRTSSDTSLKEVQNNIVSMYENNSKAIVLDSGSWTHIHIGANPNITLDNAIKIYVPIDGTNANVVTKQVLDFLLENNIASRNKVGSHVKGDAFVLRIFDKTDAKRVINFINEQVKLNPITGKEMPLTFKAGGVSVAMDGLTSYNQIATILIDNFAKNNLGTDITGFKEFVHALNEQIINGDVDLFETMFKDQIRNLEENPYVDNEQLAKANIYEVIDIIDKALNNNMSANEFVDYISEYQNTGKVNDVIKRITGTEVINENSNNQNRVVKPNIVKTFITKVNEKFKVVKNNIGEKFRIANENVNQFKADLKEKLEIRRAENSHISADTSNVRIERIKLQMNSLMDTYNGKVDFIRESVIKTLEYKNIPVTEENIRTNLEQVLNGNYNVITSREGLRQQVINASNEMNYCVNELSRLSLEISANESGSIVMNASDLRLDNIIKNANEIGSRLYGEYVEMHSEDRFDDVWHNIEGYFEQNRYNNLVVERWTNGNFLNFTIGQQKHSALGNAVKMYIPINHANASYMVKTIIEQLAKNNIASDNKIARIARSDAFVLRIYDVNDAYRVANWINNNFNLETTGSELPLSYKFGKIGIAMDGRTSYNSIVTQLIRFYSQNYAQNTDVNGFKDFIRNLKENVILNKNTDILETIFQSEFDYLRERYKMEYGYDTNYANANAYANLYEIVDIVDANLNGNMSPIDFFRYLNEYTKPAKVGNIITNLSSSQINEDATVNQTSSESVVINNNQTTITIEEAVRLIANSNENLLAAIRYQEMGGHQLHDILVQALGMKQEGKLTVSNEMQFLLDEFVANNGVITNEIIEGVKQALLYTQNQAANNFGLEIGKILENMGYERIMEKFGVSEETILNVLSDLYNNLLKAYKGYGLTEEQLNKIFAKIKFRTLDEMRRIYHKSDVTQIGGVNILGTSYINLDSRMNTRFEIFLENVYHECTHAIGRIVQREINGYQIDGIINEYFTDLQAKKAGGFLESEAYFPRLVNILEEIERVIDPSRELFSQVYVEGNFSSLVDRLTELTGDENLANKLAREIVETIETTHKKMRNATENKQFLMKNYYVQQAEAFVDYLKLQLNNNSNQVNTNNSQNINESVNQESNNNVEEIEMIDESTIENRGVLEANDVVDVIKVEPTKKSKVDLGTRKFNINDSYEGYKYVVKAKNGISLEQVINEVIKNNDGSNILIEINNTTELTLDLINKIPDNVKVRVIGNYTEEYMKGFKRSPGQSGLGTLKNVTYTKEQLTKIMERIYEFEKGINPNWTDTQKAEYAYNWLRENMQYHDKKLINEFNNKAGLKGGNANRLAIYDGLANLIGIEIEGKHVMASTCQGFAATYQELLTRMGIEAYNIAGGLNGEGGHGFNIIKIDGKTFIVDPVREFLNENSPGYYPGTGFKVANINQYYINPHIENYKLLQEAKLTQINQISENLSEIIYNNGYNNMNLVELCDYIKNNFSEENIPDNVKDLIRQIDDINSDDTGNNQSSSSQDINNSNNNNNNNNDDNNDNSDNSNNSNDNNSNNNNDTGNNSSNNMNKMENDNAVEERISSREDLNANQGETANFEFDRATNNLISEYESVKTRYKEILNQYDTTMDANERYDLEDEIGNFYNKKLRLAKEIVDTLNISDLFKINNNDLLNDYIDYIGLFYSNESKYNDFIKSIYDIYHSYKANNDLNSFINKIGEIRKVQIASTAFDISNGYLDMCRDLIMNGPKIDIQNMENYTSQEITIYLAFRKSIILECGKFLGQLISENEYIEILDSIDIVSEYAKSKGINIGNELDTDIIRNAMKVKEGNYGVVARNIEIYEGNIVGANQGAVRKALRSGNPKLIKPLIEQVRKNHPNLTTMDAIKFLKIIEYSRSDLGVCNYAIFVNAILEANHIDIAMLEEKLGYKLIENGKLNDARLLADIFTNLNPNFIGEKGMFNHKMAKNNEGYINLSAAYNSNLNSIDDGLNIEAMNKFFREKNIPVVAKSENLIEGLRKNKLLPEQERNYIINRVAEALKNGDCPCLSVYAGTQLYDASNNEIIKLDDAHIVTIFGINENGDLRVDSWGKEYIIKTSDLVNSSVIRLNSLRLEQVDSIDNVDNIERQVKTERIDNIEKNKEIRMPYARAFENVKIFDRLKDKIKFVKENKFKNAKVIVSSKQQFYGETKETLNKSISYYEKLFDDLKIGKKSLFEKVDNAINRDLNTMKNYISRSEVSNTEAKFLTEKTFLRLAEKYWGNEDAMKILSDIVPREGDTLRETIASIGYRVSELELSMYEENAAINEIHDVLDIPVKIIGNSSPILYLRLNEFEKAISRMPDNLKNILKTIDIKIYDTECFENASSSIDYFDTPNKRFVIYAGTIGNELRFYEHGASSLTGIPSIEYETITHELGHIIDNRLGNSEKGYTEISDEWQKAMEADKLLTSKNSVSDYGETTIAEDFAESIKFYYRSAGFLKKNFPNRARLVEECINNINLHSSTMNAKTQNFYRSDTALNTKAVKNLLSSKNIELSDIANLDSTKPISKIKDELFTSIKSLEIPVDSKVIDRLTYLLDTYKTSNGSIYYKDVIGNDTYIITDNNVLFRVDNNEKAILDIVDYLSNMSNSERNNMFLSFYKDTARIVNSYDTDNINKLHRVLSRLFSSDTYYGHKTKYIDLYRDTNYGAKQDIISYYLKDSSLKERLVKLVKSIYPGMDDINANRLLRHMEVTPTTDEGMCSYSVIANMIYEKYYGNSEAFLNDFGYEMSINSKLNSGELMTDIYAYCNKGVLVNDNIVSKTNEGQVSLSDRLVSSMWNKLFNTNLINNFFKSKNINLEVSEEVLFDYYNINGNTNSLSKNLFDGIISNIVKSLEQGKHVAIALSDFDIIVDGFEERINNNHVMSIASVLDNGLLEVDSWGKKCYIDLKNVTKSASQITISELSLNEK